MLLNCFTLFRYIDNALYAFITTSAFGFKVCNTVFWIFKSIPYISQHIKSTYRILEKIQR